MQNYFDNVGEKERLIITLLTCNYITKLTLGENDVEKLLSVIITVKFCLRARSDLVELEYAIVLYGRTPRAVCEHDLVEREYAIVL